MLSEIARRHLYKLFRPDSTARCKTGVIRFLDALRRIDEAVLRDPQNTSLFEVKIEISMRAKRFKQAGAVIREGLQALPQNCSLAEKSIRLLLECGDAEAACASGSRRYSRHCGGLSLAALGRTLHDHRRFAAQGEIESVLRSSWFIQSDETADYLSMLLVELRRYSEAEDLMHSKTKLNEVKKKKKPRIAAD